MIQIKTRRYTTTRTTSRAVTKSSRSRESAASRACASLISSLEEQGPGHVDERVRDRRSQDAARAQVDPAVGETRERRQDAVTPVGRVRSVVEEIGRASCR